MPKLEVLGDLESNGCEPLIDPLSGRKFNISGRGLEILQRLRLARLGTVQEIGRAHV